MVIINNIGQIREIECECERRLAMARASFSNSIALATRSSESTELCDKLSYNFTEEMFTISVPMDGSFFRYRHNGKFDVITSDANFARAIDHMIRACDAAFEVDR
jgi:hypothetical protein